MARKSQRISAGVTSTPRHKRAASSSTAANADVKKAKTQKVTPTKSQYFTNDDKSESNIGAGNDEDSDDEMLSSAPEDELSEFESDVEADEDDEANEDDDYDSEDDAPKPSKNSAAGKGATAVSASGSKKGSEVWREGVKTGLGPGKQLVIKKAKARLTGKVPYADETIHSNTLLFLTDLKANNDREWLKSKSLLSLLRGLSAADVSATLRRRITYRTGIPSALASIPVHSARRLQACLGRAS